MSLTQEQAAILLRKPFAADQVGGKLPKISCRACSKAPGKICQDHQEEMPGVRGTT